MKEVDIGKEMEDEQVKVEKENPERFSINIIEEKRRIKGGDEKMRKITIYESAHDTTPEDWDTIKEILTMHKIKFEEGRPQYNNYCAEVEVWHWIGWKE